MSEPNTCCGLTPKGVFDTKLKKWFFSCSGACGRSTTGHSSKKKAVESWNKMVAQRW